MLTDITQINPKVLLDRSHRTPNSTESLLKQPSLIHHHRHPFRHERLTHMLTYRQEKYQVKTDSRKNEI